MLFHEMPSEVALIGRFCDFESMSGSVLLVGGSPEPSSADLVAWLADACDHVVAVDRGLDTLLLAGRSCDLFCGDADSVGDAGSAAVRQAELGQDDSRRACDAEAPACPASRSAVGEVERYNPLKDFTDLDLALRAVRSRWGDVPLVGTCLSGGVPDHAFAVYGRLLSWKSSVRLVEDGFRGSCFEARLLGPGNGCVDWELPACVGSRFSFVPLSPESSVSLEGMKWELDHKRVSLLSDLGISNEITSRRARVRCHDGAIAAWLYR